MRELAIIALTSLFVLACGGDDDNGGSECGFTSDRYLPYEAGNRWTYQVTDLDDGMRTTKEQSLKPTDAFPEFGEVLEQETLKANGRTVNYARIENNAVVSFRQEDYDATGAFERASEYIPWSARLDEAPEHLMAGASWDEVYTVVEKDANGTEVLRTDRIDHWEVLGVDVECSSPLGTFSCLHVRKVRTQGGVADKEYFFAPGIGKIREVGGQLEELTSCGVAE